MNGSDHVAASQPERLAAFLAGRAGLPLEDVPVVTWPGGDLSRGRMASFCVIAGAAGSADSEGAWTEWDISLREAGVTPEFSGRYRSAGRGGCPDTGLAVLRRSERPQPAQAPDGFTVIAILAVYNEQDVLPTVLDHLAAQGVQTYVMDNWSQDATLDIARARLGGEVVGLEQWPATGPSGTFDLRGQLCRKEELALELKADWLVHQDADELRRSPWPGVSVRDALHHVGALGYTAVNHTLLDVELTQDSWQPGLSLQDHLSWFRPVTTADRMQISTWARQPTRVDLASSGGHVLKFPGRRLFPYNFLLEHYPQRTVEQAKRKVLKDRLARYPEAERKMGWHYHYDHLATASDDEFLVSTEGLLHKDADFERDFLLERISGLDLAREPDPRSVKHEIAAALNRVGLFDFARRLRRRSGRR